MATTILKGLNASSLVSSVEINAESGEVKTEKAKITEIKTGETLSFSRLDEAMPWPIPADIQVALKIPGFTPLEELSVYTLKVSHLSAPNYTVLADGQSLGIFTKEQLAAGVNLSQPAIKVLPEIKQLLEAITRKNDLFFERWRNVQVAEVPAWIPAETVETGRAAKIKELDDLIAQAETTINVLRLPKPHQWVIAPVL